MHLIRFIFLLLCLAAPLSAAEAVSAKIIKVLPQFLDRNGQNSTAPSLYARDAYQAYLRRNPKQRAGLRFAVQWKVRNATNLTLRVELRGVRTNEATSALLELPVEKHGWFSTWSDAALTGEKFKELGEMNAWRVTLWSDKKQLAEQKSFLW